MTRAYDKTRQGPSHNPENILATKSLTYVIKNFICSAESIKNYLKQGFKITNSDDPKEDTLWNALAYGLDSTSIMLLVDNGAVINNSEELHKNTLYCALRQPYLQSTYEFLIEKGANPEKLSKKDHNNITSLKERPFCYSWAKKITDNKVLLAANALEHHLP